MEFSEIDAELYEKIDMEINETDLKLCERVDSHLGKLKMVEILQRKNSLVDEIENFYGITKDESGNYTGTDIDLELERNYPEFAYDFLSPWLEDVNTNLIGYDNVRKGFLEWHSRNQKSRNLSLGMALTGVAGILTSAVLLDPPLNYLGAVASLGIEISAIGNILEGIKLPDCCREYIKFHGIAEDGDQIIRDVYPEYNLQRDIKYFNSPEVSDALE
jgi:hypothetical protein